MEEGNENKIIWIFGTWGTWNKSSKQHMFTMKGEHNTNASHIVDVLHMFVSDLDAGIVLPSTFYVQFDNCTRESKNRYLFSHIDCHVAWSIFKNAEISFPPAGHTQENIEQIFS